MAINARELPLEKVFTPDFRFVIPSFQRAYIWKPENILKLIDDLREAGASPMTPYFLGSIILVRDEAHGRNRFEVIDGQQRLVSLSIIFAALRDLEQDGEWMRKLDELLVEPGDRLRGIIKEPRLKLRERDAEFFREYVQQDNLEALFDLTDEDLETAAQRNIRANTQKAYDALKDMGDQERRDFASYMVNQVTLVIVTTDDLDGAHRIFDVMNMRGLPLTPSDVFKARATAALRPAEMDAYAERWDDVMDPLGDDPRATEEFFSYLHLIVTHEPATDKLIEDFVADVIQPHAKGGTIPVFIDKVLAPYAMAWQVLSRPYDAALPTEVRGRLESLNDYRIHEWKPVAMWALTHSFRNLGAEDVSPFSRSGSHVARGSSAANELGAHDEQRLIEILDALERLSGVESLTRTGAARRRGRAAATIRDLDKGYSPRLVRALGISAEDRAGALVRLHGEMQGDEELARLLLIRANEQRNGGRISRPRALSALPVMPLDIERSRSFSGWSQEEHDHWMYRLGNMALVQGAEDQLDRVREYPERRSRFLLKAGSRKFPLTKQLEDFSECTPQMLRARQDETVRLIADHWEIRYDDHHDDLTRRDIEDLATRAPRQARGSRRVTIAQVVAAGLLIPGETLVWDRPRKGERWVATVTTDGKFRLEDGGEYSSPTAAAKAAAGGRGSAGLDVWRRTSNGQKLSDIWQEYRLRSR